MLALIVAVALTILSYKSPVSSIVSSKFIVEVTPTPKVELKISPYPIETNTVTPTKKDTTQNQTPQDWGKLIKTGDLTYTIKVANDEVMTTPQEALVALNDLRKRYGAQPLVTDSRLCEYAQKRAEYFNSIGGIDAHKGFEEFLEKEDGFKKLGFQKVGENSSYGYKLSGVHLIEFVYMQSPTHNENQLNPDWDKGCVGVSGTATNFIFATSPF